MQLRIGSLFAGVGGLELGLEASGIGVTVYQVEKDPFCREQLARHWPSVPRFAEIEAVQLDGLPACDLVCGGFPCQDISVANAKGNVTGARAGLAGARSGLWGHMRAVVEHQRPQWVVVENVARGWKKWLPAVRGDLGQLGYDTLPVALEARYVGAPHVRERLFVLAHADGFALRVDEQRLPRRRQDRLRDGRDAQPVEPGRHAGWPSGPGVGVRAHGLPRGLGQHVWSAYGNAVVPQVAEVVGWVIRELVETGGCQARKDSA